MRVKTRQRHCPDGRAVWTADIHVAPAGSQEPERFRVTAPPTVTTRSGAERWAMDTARRIAAEGRPRNTKRGREERAQLAEAARAAHVPTLAEFWPTFVEHMTAERMKPNTVLLYTGMAQRRLLPLLGQLPLHRVGELDVQRLKASMSDQAPSHVNSALTVLVQLLRLAHAHHPAVAVPAVRRVCSVAANDRVRVYTRDQAAALVEVLAGHGERLAALLLALDAGLRRGEVHGLRWCDVDLEAGELVVRRARGEEGAGG